MLLDTVSAPFSEAAWLALSSHHRELTNGPDPDAVIQRVWGHELQLPCWVLDGVRGTHPPTVGQFTQAAGEHKAPVTPDELCRFFENLAFAIGGNLSLGLHSGLYYDAETEVGWDELEYQHFERYVQTADTLGCSVGYHPTLFNHPKAKQGHWLLTISSDDAATRRFFVNHVMATIRIAEQTAQVLGRQIFVNIWAIDGYKADPADRLKARSQMFASLLEIILIAQKECPHVDIGVEFKLTAAETAEYTVGSIEFLQGVATRTGCCLTIDLGHSYLGRDWADIISAYAALGVPLAVHVSRGAYGDDDLTVTNSTSLQKFFREIYLCGIANKTWVGIDCFDSRVEPILAMYISACSVRVAQVLAELYPQPLIAKTERVSEGGKLLVAQEADLFSPAMIIGRARTLFNLPSADTVIELAKTQ